MGVKMTDTLLELIFSSCHISTLVILRWTCLSLSLVKDRNFKSALKKEKGAGGG